MHLGRFYGILFKYTLKENCYVFRNKLFISAVCIISLILFTEVFPKWTKLLVGAVQVVTTSYAIAILIKKIGEWTSVWSGDYKYINSNFLWILPIVAVITIAVAYICNKKSKKAAK